VPQDESVIGHIGNFRDSLSRVNRGQIVVRWGCETRSCGRTSVPGLGGVVDRDVDGDYGRWSAEDSGISRERRFNVRTRWIENCNVATGPPCR
jgi:hypothetical protein